MLQKFKGLLSPILLQPLHQGLDKCWLAPQHLLRIDPDAPIVSVFVDIMSAHMLAHLLGQRQVGCEHRHQVLGYFFGLFLDNALLALFRAPVGAAVDCHLVAHIKYGHGRKIQVNVGVHQNGQRRYAKLS